MEQPDPPKRSGWIFAVVAMFVLPLLYVLSYGPVIWLVHHGYLIALGPRVFDFFQVVYAPLPHMYENSPAFAAFLDWYVRLWYPGVP